LKDDPKERTVITPLQIHQFEQNGYTIVQQMFSPEEVETYVDHFMQLRREGSFAGDFAGVNADGRYPQSLPTHDPYALAGTIVRCVGCWSRGINRARTAFLE
jgi:hypothetical protein